MSSPASATRPAISFRSPSAPALRANPCPEVTDPFCRLPLPTLFYRPEAVHLGDLLRIWVRRSARFHRSASLGFSRAGDRTRDSARAAELCGNIAVAPSLGANPFQAACDLTKKRELFPGLTTTSPRSLALPRLDEETPTTVSASTLRNIDRIPFRSFRGQMFQKRKKSRAFRMAFAYDLGSADPCSTAVHMEPFSTSVFRGLVGIFATTTEICTRGGSSRARARTFDAHHGDPPTRRSIDGRENSLPRRPGIGSSLQRHPFSGLVDSAGELLHTP